MTDRHRDPETLLEHLSWTRQLAYRLIHDAAVAEDVAQESVLAAWQRPPDGNMRAWLSRVVRYRSWSYLRSEARRRRREQSSARDERLPSTDEVMDRAELQRELVGAVFELDDPFRTTLVLRYFEGLSTVAIATQQGIAEATVRSRLKRALDTLRERYDRKHGDRRGWQRALLPIALPPLSLTTPSFPTTAAPTTPSRPTVSSDVGRLLSWSWGALLMKYKVSVIVALMILASTLRWFEPWRTDSQGLADQPASGASSLATETEESAAAADPRAVALDVDTTMGAATASSPEPTGKGCVSGIVIGPDRGPLAGVVVHAARAGEEMQGMRLPFGLGMPVIVPALDDPKGRCVTDVSGTFRIEGLRDGDHAVIARAQAYEDHIESLVTIEGDSVVELTIQLQRGLVLSGRVVDTNGQPVADAHVFTGVDGLNVDGKRRQVSLDFGSKIMTSASATSDADGRFVLEGLAFGNHPITATHPGHARTTVHFASGSRDVKIRMGDFAKLRGHIVDASGERESAEFVGVTLQLKGPGQEGTLRGETDDDGRFVFERLHPGPHRVAIVDPSAAVGFSRAITLEAGDDVDIELPWRARARVHGSVVDSDGHAVSGARITIASPSDASERDDRITGRSDDDGHFDLDGLAVGDDYVVRVECEGQGKVDLEPFVIESADHDLGTVALGASARVFGVVFDADGRALAGASVKLAPFVDLGGLSAFVDISDLGLPTRHQVSTDVDGRFGFEGVEAGDYRVRAEAAGCIAASSSKLSIVEGDDRQVPALRLERGARISGRLLDPDGGPVVGGDVQASRSFPKLMTKHMKTDAEGRFTIDGLEEVSYEVTGSAPGLSLSAPIAAKAGESAPLELRLTVPGTLVGRVVEHDGTPVVRFKVSMSRKQTSFILDLDHLMRDARFQAPLDFQHPDGEFVVPDLDPGKYTVTVSADDHIEVSRELEVANGRDVELRVELDGAGSIEGVVVDSHGDPIAGVSVAAVDADGESKVRSSFSISISSTQGAEQTLTTGTAPDQRTDRDGHFFVTGLRPGRATVRVVHDDYESADIEVFVRRGEVVDVPRVRLYRGSSIRGRVADKEGKDVPQAFLRFREIDADGKKTASDPVTILADSHGRYEKKGLRPGRYRVIVGRLGGGLQAFARMASEDDSSAVTIEIAREQQLERDWVIE